VALEVLFGTAVVNALHLYKKKKKINIIHMANFTEKLIINILGDGLSTNHFKNNTQTEKATCTYRRKRKMFALTNN
jgi:capsular polysaccharide biosynthesis protein